MVLGFSVGMEAFDELLSIMFPGVRSSLMFSGFGLKPPTSGFSLIFTVLSRLLLYSTVDKTSPFDDNGLLFWVPDVLCRHSEVVLWN